MRRAVVLSLVGVVLVLGLVPSGASAATCSSHPNQASAQRAADTRDGDGDGFYCESLPCPCAKSGSSTPAPAPAPAPTATKPRRTSCVKSAEVAPIGFSGTKYPTIRQHWEDAIEAGWPRVLMVNRPGADARRDRLLQGFSTRDGFDRDEYPPAVGRGRGPKWLRRGVSPIGWMASVAYVPASENRSHGSTLGIKLRRYCNGQRFRYVFY